MDHLVVHADVKPSNIMVTGSEHGCLADFDLSLNYSERISTAFASTSRTAVGYTPGFEAPELLHTGSTIATDMYAFGKTVECVKGRCGGAELSEAFAAGELEGEPLTSAAADEFIHLLTAPDPSERLKADEALKHSFFSPVLAWSLRQIRECSLFLCEKCPGGRVALKNGIECSHGHFLCNGCLEMLTKQAGSDEIRIQFQREGRILCPHCLIQVPTRDRLDDGGKRELGLG